MKKRILILALAALVSFGGIATAQDLGLTVGAEFVIPDFDNIDFFGMALRPFVEYENNELVDGLDLMAGLGFIIAPIGSDVVDAQFNIDAELDLYYGLDLGSGMGLGFGLNFGLATSNLTGDADLTVGFELTPRVRFEMEMADLGDIYAQVELPIGFDTEKDSDATMGLNFWAGLFMDMGLGIELGLAGYPTLFSSGVGIDFGLGDGNEAGLESFALVPSYRYDFLYAELGVYIPLVEKGMDTVGLTLVPRVEVDFTTIAVPGLKAWVELPISSLGTDGDNIIGLTIGVSYSF